MATKKAPKVEKDSAFKKLIDAEDLHIPNLGDVVKGKVLAVSKTEIKIDLAGYKTGVVRGKELYSESTEFTGIKIGDDAEATVIDRENENGDLELSFRFAGHRKAWDNAFALKASGEAIQVTVIEANKGGLMVRLGNLLGFLPVSQLAPEHYPRVAGGEKQKILEKLKTFVGTTMTAKVIDASEGDEKLIVSEKSIWEEEQKNVLAKYHVGDMVEGDVTAVTDFGAFVKFDSLEGLVHISEIAWQRIDHPRDVLKVGDHVKAQVIGIQGSKIFLSMKKLVDDPWKSVVKKYNVGDMVKGKILKANPFGFFVELDPEIHGLAHVSELSNKAIKDPLEVASVGDVLDWKIVSIEADNHRLGLSLKTGTEEKPAKKAKKSAEGKEDATDEKGEDSKEDAKEEKVADEKTEEKADDTKSEA